MRKSVLVKILKTFNSKDLSEFRKFLQSPYHTETKLLLELFDYLRRFQPEYTSHRLKKTHIAQLFFADKSYTDAQAAKRLTNMAAQLKLLVEEYLAIREFKKDKFLKNRMLVQAYYETNNYDLFKGEVESALKSIEKMEYQDERYYLEKVLLGHLEYDYPLTPKSKETGSNMKSILENLDEFFVLYKLKGGIDLVTRKKIRSKEYGIELLDEVLELIKNEKHKNKPRYYLYQFVIKIFQEKPNMLNYFQLKREFQLNKAKLSMKERKNIWTCLINYYLALVRENENIDKREVLELQKIGLKDKYLLSNNQISIIQFENIVVGAAFFKEFDWIKGFIKTYANLLPKDQKENAVTISWAYYYFHKKEFDKVIELLQDVEFTDHYYKSRTRSLLLRSYYELIDQNDKYYESFLSLSQSFEKFLRRDKSKANNYRKGYLNFIILIKLLAKVKTVNYRNQEYKDIVKKLSTFKYLVARPWFEEKLATF